jgi:predicted acylesterase/phospholipase RssA/proteasome lid subunit RPN8/RPN11
MISGQTLALRQLEDVAAISGDALKLLAVTHVGEGAAAWLCAEVDVPCGHYPRAPDGIAFEPRERLLIYIPPGFPFDRPHAVAPHQRWAGYPHVMRDQTLCLYQAPANEWDPSDGMFGFLQRLDQWLAAAALGELDPMGAPLHPPLAYTMADSTAPSVIVRADAPEPGTAPWLGFAILERRGNLRLELTDWIALTIDPVPSTVAPAVLLTEPFPSLFPRRVRDLIAELKARGVPRWRLLLLLKLAAFRNEPKAPLHFVVGAPMRGVRGEGNLRQHLEIWHIPGVVADGLRATVLAADGSGELHQLGEEIERLVLEWADHAEVDWCDVLEARPEIVVSRDTGRPTAWFEGRAVAVWGCGALGGPIAESLVRAGVRKLVLRDKAVVRPGLLVRQLFDDADIGRGKAEALAERLRRIRPDLEIVANGRDLLRVLDEPTWHDDVEVIIETTGSESVLSKLELVRRQSTKPPAIASMVVGHEAKHGFVAIAGSRHTGGPMDVCRRAKIVACSRPDLYALRDEFWPEPRRRPFQPEPGCSEPTFVGGAADVGALAGILLNALGEVLQANVDAAVAHFATLPSTLGSLSTPAFATLRFSPDLVVDDPHAGFEIRLAREAYAEIQSWLRRSTRLAGATVETGGYLFGDRDDATGVLWVTEASGPPRDSAASSEAFVCGVEGVDALVSEKRQRTRDALRLVGLWHAHPDAPPLPSATDVQGMAHVIADSPAPSARALLMIIGNTVVGPPIIGAYDFSREDLERISRGRLSRPCEMRITLQAVLPPARVGLALSGGGSRAIAFHLGCLRALHDRGILDQLRVISCVSGGSVIGAMYAYSERPFEAFDRAVVGLLRRGLLRGMAHGTVQPRWLLRTLSTMVTAGVAAKVTDAVRLLLGGAARLTGANRFSLSRRIARFQPPLRRWSSRTDLLEATLRAEPFGHRPITSPRRGNIDIVLNACELRTGSALRFGSHESGCWRYGRVADNSSVEIAQAVAGSAAYPVLLPALDRAVTFVDHHGQRTTRRVLITDGGIFDNLGTSCLEPGRDEAISTNVFNTPYVIACDAGAGIFGDRVVPYWWPTRMTRAFETVFRKAGNGAQERLHQARTTGALKGFILAYLGQRDERLPYRPSDLVPREDVMDYPTDFAPMAQADIDRLTARGEQLTRLLIDYYCSEL